MTELIRGRLAEISDASVNEVKKYLNVLSEGGDFKFSMTDEENKRITAAYYSCAVALISHVDLIAKLAGEVNSLINSARSECDEDKMLELISLFEAISQRASAYESFLKSSEEAVSGKSKEISPAGLRNIAINLVRELSLAKK